MNDIKDFSQQSSDQPLRVFLVEDSLDVRELIIENLSMIPGLMIAGMSESENDALDQLDSLKCDVLIVDIQLKKGNGISLLRQISEQSKAANNMFKIICSNNASEVFRRAGQQYGVRHFFDKTSEFPQLFALLKDLGANRNKVYQI